MKVAVFDIHSFERDILIEANHVGHELTLLESRLTEETALLAQGHECVCVFVNDILNRKTLSILSEGGTKFIVLRSAGFNNVDLSAAKEMGMGVARVPEYSPFAVAEYAVGLILCLNRKIHKAYNRVREGNFSLDGLVGLDLHGKTIGVVGTGRIGQAFVRIMKGFGCEVVAFDLHPDEAFARQVGCRYVSFLELVRTSDVISLHVPLSKASSYLFSAETFKQMKKGCILINTGRGGLVDTKAMIESLKSGRLGGAGLDVYEEEADFFFEDHSRQILQDDVLSRLMTFPNVLLTGHQGFLTGEALRNIASTTFKNFHDFEMGLHTKNQVV